MTKEEVSAKKRQWRHENPDRLKLIYRRHRAKDPKRRLLMDCKKRAKKLGMPFDLTVDDIILPEVCPIFGWGLTNIQGHGNRVKTNVSIDRIDNTRGYEKGNVQVLCSLANYMKSVASEEELILFAKGVLNHYGVLN